MGMLNYIDPNLSGGSVFLVILSFLLSIGSGVGVGILLKKFFLIGFVILGGFCGYLLAGLIYSLVFISWVNTSALLIIMQILFIAGAAFACFKQKEHLSFFCTALIGGYFFIRGISMYVGNYPNEIQMYQDIENGTAQFTMAFFGYLIGMVVMTIIGTIYQERTHKEHNHEHFEKVAGESLLH